ncbi:MAG: imidazolonepropionase [Bacteroidota bacterium]|nr:imidazolonepropionase [Candidatus Kapabacteria bacterium]MDW8221224.1 imidazolonepropionase [Bacteroidota bacterium]
MSSLLIYNIGSLVTPHAQTQLRLAGDSMGNIHIQTHAAILVEDGIITRIGDSATLLHELRTTHNTATLASIRMLDANGMTAIPGFVDSHTHLVFAGNRAQEFALRARGKTYQEIAAAGGGILSTMRATRNASAEELLHAATKRLDTMLRYGTTTVEIKSGYGLNTTSEFKILEVIAELQRTHPITIVPTFLGAHAFPPELRDSPEEYIDRICSEMLPEIQARNLATFCDAFCEQGYFSLAQSERILRTAQDLGFRLKLHADQLSAFGASELGVRLQAVSVDHLECTGHESIRSIAASSTIATALPGASLFLRHSYAPVRALIDAGATVALATDCNPGSSMTISMPLMMTLATTQMHMSPEEALTACTLNAAAALLLSHEYGSLEVGKKADILLADVSHFYELAYYFGVNHIVRVIKHGEIVV